MRAFAAPKAFQSGVSLEQLLSACHWKSHNPFSQFCLKDDSELFPGDDYAADPPLVLTQIGSLPREYQLDSSSFFLRGGLLMGVVGVARLVGSGNLFTGSRPIEPANVPWRLLMALLSSILSPKQANHCTSGSYSSKLFISKMY